MTGMLWFDREGTVGERVLRAVEYYRRKHGQEATVVQVHPSQAEAAQQAGLPVRVEAVASTLINHYLVGRDG